MCEKEKWIEGAKKHFIKIGANRKYTKGDENSEKSKEINQKLQELSKKYFGDDDELGINIEGNKWGIQGQNILNSYIWYPVYYKKYGNNYPIVINFGISSVGLYCSIGIYDTKLNDLEINKLLLVYMKEVFKESEIFKWSDKNYELQIEINKDSISKIIKKLKEKVKVINLTIFNDMIDLFNKSKSSLHCKIEEKDSHYKKRKNVKNLVDEFISSDSPIEEQFRAFWNKETINSVQQASNATNIINRNESLGNLHDKIRILIELSVKVKNSVALTKKDDLIYLINEIEEQIKSSKNSSLELYYYYHMEKDEFPLINGGIKNAISILDKNEIKMIETNIVQKMVKLKEKMKENSLEQLYLLDQFLNLIDKIKYNDIKNEKGTNKELYQLAYLFTFFRKKTVSNSQFFDDLLKKSKNIILYGAPGTGKTYTSEMNISRIIEEDYPNDKIELSDRFQKVQFHPSYNYEDFMEGLKPDMVAGQMILKLEKGDFMKFCESASYFEEKYINAKDNEKLKFAFFFLVDEINRAELSRVFGEIMYALDKRGNTIRTQYSYLKEGNDKYFLIPKNVYFIGTMNDVDRSIDSFDIALRRRFFWYRMDCDYRVIQVELSQFENIGGFNNKDVPESGYLESCYKLNRYITIELGLGKLYELGHSYFMEIEKHTEKKVLGNKDLEILFDFSIAPLLREYIRTQYNSEFEIEDKLKKAKKEFKLETKIK